MKTKIMTTLFSMGIMFTSALSAGPVDDVCEYGCSAGCGVTYCWACNSSGVCITWPRKQRQ